MADGWYFSRERIRNSPSVKDGGIDFAKELGYRQQCANFIQDIGQRLSVSQLCINTSIVYMHRFYMFHSFKQFHRNTMAPCFIFLGAKVEEQPRKLEHVLKVAHKCLHKDSEVQLDLQSDEYMQMAQDLIDNESILLQTLGFDLSVEHPHTYVVKCAQMVKAAKELAQTSYFLATNSLHLTTFCIEEKPTVIACVCIYVACKWTSYEIPETHDKKRWWEYMDSNITLEKIEDMSSHFIKILDSCPTRLKKKISTGPVIYKGGTIQPKKDCDVEHGKFDKLIDNNANKTHSKVEGTSSRMGDHRPDKHSAVYNRHSDNQVEVRKDLHDTSPHLKKHAKHSSQSEHDKRNLEHHKHHKRKHSDHSKQQSEKPKSQESRAKRTEDVNHEKSDSLEMKASSSSRPLDGSKPKVSQSQSGSLSSAAKHILSLPPLHHKHSLPDTDGTSVGESPSKKQKVSMASGQKQKLDGEMDRIVSQTDDNTYIGTSSGSHKKPKPVIEKHKMRISSEKHAEMYRQMQRASDKSHGQKIHYDKHSKGKKVEHPKSSNAHGQGNIDSNSLKKKDEFVSSFKLREEVNQLSHDSAVSSQNPKQSAVPRKSSSSEKRTQKVSHSTPKKNGHSSKLTFKTGSVTKELSLPPPPPPPSFNVPNILAGQPPLPTDPDVKQKPAPAPPDDFEDSVAIQQSYIMSDGQVQTSVMQNQMQGQLYSVQDQATQNQQNQTLVPRDYQQQLFSSSAQSVNSSSNALTTPQLYYQGQDRVQAGTSDVSQAYWQSINSTSLFSPNNIGLLTQPPVPPQGLVIHQIDGLPPPPPPILPPFPPPPT